jgi:hypothetical protein
MRGGSIEIGRYIQSVRRPDNSFKYETYFMERITDEDNMERTLDRISDNGCSFVNGNQYNTRYYGAFTSEDLRGSSLSIGIFQPEREGEPPEEEMVFIFYHQLDDSTAPTPIGFISCSIKGNLCKTKFECCNASGIYSSSGGDRSRKVYSSSVTKQSNAKYDKPKEASRKYNIKASHLMQAFYIRYMDDRLVRSIYKAPVDTAIQYNIDTGFLYYDSIEMEFDEAVEEKEKRQNELKTMGLEDSHYSVLDISDVMTGSPNASRSINYKSKDNDDYRKILLYMKNLISLES